MANGNTNLLSIYNSRIRGIIQSEHNGYDTYVYPKIDEGKRAAARNNFGTGMDETILLIRDTGFWNNCDQGLVMTTDGIYCIPDNENKDSRFVFGWHDVKEVKYQELCLYFYDYEGNNCPIHMSYFIKSDSDSTMSSIGRKLAPALTQLAQAVAPLEDPLKVADEELRQLCENNQTQEAINFCKECINNNVGEFPEYFYYRLSMIYSIDVKDNKSSLAAANEGLRLCGDNLYLKTLLQYCKYSADFVLGNIAQSRKDCLSVALNSTDQTGPDGQTLLKNESADDFKVLEDEYVNSFLDQPYNERKVLMPVKEYKNLLQDHLSVLKIQNLPNIDFPMGHPIANQLYVGHPLIPLKYIPFENYQLELVEDKVREFCQLAQSLGATEITIDCLNSSSSDGSVKGKNGVSVNIDHWAADGSGSRNRDYSRHMIEELSRSISLHQTFEPHNKPTVPEGLVWYDNEPSWQRLVSQRINGGLTSHQERIETKKSQMIEGREMTEIKAEVKSLFLDMSVNFDTTEEQKFSAQENAVLSINVKFAPLSQLNGSSSNNNQNLISSSNSTYTSEEKEYLEEVQECLADGEIGPRERRLLDKIRSKLGISEARASELEASLATPKLTEDEQEYLKEYKECAIDGIVSDKERRLLDKVRKMLGISEERAAEIEKLIK